MRTLPLARWGGVALLGGALVGCAQPPRPLYHWGGFQNQLYAHFKSDGSGPAEQLRLLEAEALRAQGAGLPLPPGFRGHLAMLYLKLGRDGEAFAQLEAEKAAFPESAPFMDFLLKRAHTRPGDKKDEPPSPSTPSTPPKADPQTAPASGGKKKGASS
jgi:hypothetical protein